ncbi:penicillin-binding protein activator [Legionella sp. km772]|uniref:penicillin-binding protein activator n=1 Tax=Legionella sp. km772 TaxID=2498111 RepID=UPI000F8CA328|nr:penicillin-binding protein activator [Legionella sp. km772]RUR10423.1 penicillin-binding protein activator [Legionella sp. km772]
MVKNIRKIRLLGRAILLVLLCQPQQVLWAEPISEANPVTALVNPYDLSVADYLAKAEKQQGDEQQNLLLLAAGRLISEHLWQQGLAILAQTSRLTAMQQDEKLLLLAKVDLIREKPVAALKKLHELVNSETLPLYYQIQFHELLAQAYQLTNKHSQALAERIKLETLLSDNHELSDNRRAIWLTLMQMPVPEVQVMSAEVVAESELDGWLQLANLAQQHRSNSKTLLAALDEWQSRFNEHPANSFLPKPLDSITNKILYSPKKIALLLPLTGPFSGPGNAVYEGFIAAHKKAQDDKQILTFDTNKDTVNYLYEQAISAGAEYIVGPLTKPDVARIASLWHPVPTLLLNDSENLQPNSYSFGLSPSYEAEQVALKASAKGYKRALVLAPNNKWGDDVVKAFRTQWQQEGGRITDVMAYNVDNKIKEDFNKKIRDFLQISDSERRGKQVKELLGQAIQAIPSRRQDFDMIFLLAYPSKARQIIPALKYYYSGDVPVYATSSVYGGSANALKDKDLEGVIFCDIPWVFNHQMDTKNWPEQFNSYSRLYALGKDSYALATQLNQLLLFPANSSNKRNGGLYLKANQQVARVLEWGQFKEGLAHPLQNTV